MDNNSLWQKVLENINNIVDPMAYQSWFMSIDFIGIDKNSVRLVVPILWYKTHIDYNYRDIILNSFNKFLTEPVDNIIYILQENLADVLESDKEKEVFNNTVNEKRDFIETHVSNLNKNYTFESFVVGESNKFAQAAALAVAENPGTMYNNLFIYGNVDFLLIDDIQFLGVDEKTQQEFFHTFNNLYNDSKQIIVSSDRSPEDLKVLEDRLRTRFAWGLQVDISPPDYALKMAIIRKKLKGEDININEEVISYIASNIGNDVRQLEGSITRLVAYSAIMCVTDITLDFAMEALRDFTKKDAVTDQNNIRRIQKSVANFYNISFEDMKSKKRTPNLAIPRQVAMYLCRKLTDESFERIGIEFSGKNHATVIHACNKIESEMKINRDLNDAINNIEKQLT